MVNINAPEIAGTILNIARENQCGAQVTMAATDSKDIAVRKGNIERLLTSVAISTGIRLFKGPKSAIISFSGDDFENIESRIKDAVASIDYLGQDDAKRLLKNTEFGTGVTELELDDKHFEDLKIPDIVATLKNIEAGGLAVDNKLIPSEMAEFSASRTQVHLFSTEGLAKSFSRSYYSFSYNAVAESEDKCQKEMDSWYENKRIFKELTAGGVGNIGKKAAEMAIKRLGGKKIKSAEMPVVFTSRTAATLLRLLYYAMEGDDILLRNSFLVDKLGEKLFPDKITVMDDPLMPRYLGSYPFDGEGMNGITKTAIEKGKLMTYLHNSYSAGKLNMSLTANASREISSAPGITSGNFYLQPGRGKMEDLLPELKKGLLVDDLFTSGMNDVTGDFSFGCSGFLVEKGKITAPVKEITIAGNILELFKNILEIADDNEYKSAVSSPSFLVSGLAVAGT